MTSVYRGNNDLSENKTGVAWHWLNAEQRAKGQIISKHIIQIITQAQLFVSLRATKSNKCLHLVDDSSFELSQTNFVKHSLL